MYDMKRNAYDVIASLIENVHEGFHGSSYEMIEGLRECDASTFDRRVAIARNDVDIERDARANATFNDVFDDDDYTRYFDDYVMSRMYRDVVAQMCNVVVDYTSGEIDNSSHRLRIATHNDISRALTRCIVDDMFLCIECCDDVDTSTTFNHAFFVSHIL